MNDAQLASKAEIAGRIAYFKVGGSGRSENRGMPIMPRVSCAGDALARIGLLDLRGIELCISPRVTRLPLGGLVSGLNWFNICDPDGRRRIRVLIEGAVDDRPERRAVEALAALQQTNTGAFLFESVSFDGRRRTADGSLAVVDGIRLDPGRFNLIASTPEWSLDALGWVAAMVAEVCRSVGATSSPISIRITRV